jgi:hypothetical protein
MQEVNPHDAAEAKQFSIIHGDELRYDFLEDSEKYDSSELFAKIYSNQERISSTNSQHLGLNYSSTISKKSICYER